MKSSKGVSPLIASVLLIAFTMAIAAVLTAWISSFTTGQKEKAAKSEAKIDCSYGFLENDQSFTEYNATDYISNGLLKLRIKNIGTIDVSLGSYQVWYNNVATPTMWAIANPSDQSTSIKQQDAKIMVLNVSGPDKITKIKVIANVCDGVAATIDEPLGGWVIGPASGTVVPANITA